MSWDVTVDLRTHPTEGNSDDGKMTWEEMDELRKIGAIEDLGDGYRIFIDKLPKHIKVIDIYPE